MKKIVKILIFMLILVSFATFSNAANPGIAISGKNQAEKGKTYSLKILAMDFIREGTQKAIEGKLEYDTTKLEFVKIETKNNWSVTMSGDKTGLVATKDVGLYGNISSIEEIAEITFKVKENATLGNTQIKAVDILTSADGDEIAGADQPKTIEIVDKIDEPEEEPTIDSNPEPETKPETQPETTSGTKGEVKPETQPETKAGSDATSSKEDTTKSKTEHLKTGSKHIIVLIGITSMIALGTFIGYKRYKNI